MPSIRESIKSIATILATLSGLAVAVKLLLWGLNAIGHLQTVEQIAGWIPWKAIDASSWWIAPVICALCLLCFLVANRWPAKKQKKNEGLPEPAITIPADTSTVIQTYEIKFDHLPKNMLEAGWFLAYPKNSPVKPKATLLSEAPVSGSIAIEAPADHAFEYRLPPSVYPSNRVCFTAKYLSGTMIFFWFILKPKSGKETYGRWVKILVGTNESFPTPACEDVEWTLKVPGEPLGNAWRRFDLFLPDVIRDTWGNHGLVFESVTVVRLRSSLEISPIRFYEQASRGSC